MPTVSSDISTLLSSSNRPIAKQYLGVPVSVKDYGAIGDGVADDTVAIQSAIDDLGGATSGVAGGYLRFPAGQYRITDTIDLVHWCGIIQGDGIGNSALYTASPGNSTVLIWGGDNTKPMMWSDDSRDIIFQDLRWEGRDGHKPTYGIEFSSNSVGAGSNQKIEFNRCFFGRWPWSSQGLNKGDLQSGIGYTGTNQMNDRFRIRNCVFRFCDTGMYIPNTQSIWGSVIDSVFDTCAIGIDTAATMSCFNVNFGQCDKDFRIGSTARVNVYGGYSENTKQLAELGFDSYLSIYGGLWQVGTVQTNGGVLVDMYPSRRSTLRLTGVQFTQLTDASLARITVGGDSVSGSVGNWAILVDDCDGIRPEQIDIQSGAFWASVPVSKGRVRWTSRIDQDNWAFQNYLERSKRTTIDSTRFELHPFGEKAWVDLSGNLTVESVTET